MLIVFAAGCKKNRPNFIARSAAVGKWKHRLLNSFKYSWWFCFSCSAAAGFTLVAPSGGSGLGLILPMCLIVFLAGGFRSSKS
jgi:predicted branched-subunit amino acid permease